MDQDSCHLTPVQWRSWKYRFWFQIRIKNATQHSKADYLQQKEVKTPEKNGRNLAVINVVKNLGGKLYRSNWAKYFRIYKDILENIHNTRQRQNWGILQQKIITMLISISKWKKSYIQIHQFFQVSIFHGQMF